LKCVESVIAQLKRGQGRLVVVAPNLPPEIREQLEQLGCEILEPGQVCGFEASAIPGESEARERLFFQILKWELRRFATTPTYLVIEANRELTRPTDLWNDNRPVLFCENRFRFGYLLCFNWFVGQIPYPASPACGPLLHMDRSVVDEMVAKIQGRYKAHWAQAMLAILQQVPGVAFDAGQNYGHYVGIFRAGTFSVQTSAPSGRPLNKENPGVVRMGTLGYNGRFANQIFQYAYLKLYSAGHGLRAECPPWIGCSLFGHQTTMGTDELPIYRENKGSVDEMIQFDPSEHHRDFELWGYFQDPRHWTDHRQAFRGLFEPLPFLKKPLDDAIGRLRTGNKTLVAIHLRRGDFSGGPTFWPAPEAWYLHWLQKAWPTLTNPVLYVATDDPGNVLPQLAAYAPRSAMDLNVTVNGAEFYSDFYVLSQCDVLAISNSTFSFAAAMMNTRATAYLRPDPVREELIRFDPWSSDVQLRKPESIAIAA
jgi:hypothetical protein